MEKLQHGSAVGHEHFLCIHGQLVLRISGAKLHDGLCHVSIAHVGIGCCEIFLSHRVIC